MGTVIDPQDGKRTIRQWDMRTGAMDWVDRKVICHAQTKEMLQEGASKKAVG